MEEDVAEPFGCHQSLGVLSVWSSMVHYRTSKKWVAKIVVKDDYRHIKIVVCDIAPGFVKGNQVFDHIRQ